MIAISPIKRGAIPIPPPGEGEFLNSRTLYRQLYAISPTQHNSSMDFGGITSFVSSQMYSELVVFDSLRRIAAAESDLKALVEVSTRRANLLSNIFRMNKDNQEFLIKNKMRVQTGDMLRKVVSFILDKVKEIAVTYGDMKFFTFLCKGLDDILPEIDALLEDLDDTKK